MEEQVQDSGVTASVAGEQAQDTSTDTTSVQQDTGVTSEVAAQDTDEKNYGPAIKAEIARREAKLQKEYEEKYGSLSERAKQAETYQQHLDRIAKFYNFNSHDEYLKALEQAEVERQIEDEARRLGVDPSVVQEHLQPLRGKMTELEQKLSEYQKQEQMRQIDAEVAKLKEQYPDFEQNKERVFEFAIQKGYALEDAYIVLTHQSKIEQAKLQAEQEALQKLKQNADSSTGALGQDAPEEKSGYAAMTAAEKRAFRERVKRGEQPI